MSAFDRIGGRLRVVFEVTTSWKLPLLEASILVCMNLAAMCPFGHELLIPLVRPVFLKIIEDARLSK